MQEITKHPHGSFSWADLSSTDQDDARRFYTALFGWSANDLPMGEGMVYTMLQLNGKDVVGLGPMMEEQKATGMPSVWQSYVSVDDAEAAQAKAAELGATVVVPAFDVFDSGRMVVLQDPTGAFFSMWQPINHIGSSYMNDAGTLSWFELLTNDPAKAADFYCALFDWTHSTDETGYHLFRRGERFEGGMMQIREEWGPIPPNWMVYFTVDDVDAVAARAKELGGNVMNEPFDAGVGRIAVLADPQGGGFSIIKYNDMSGM